MTGCPFCGSDDIYPLLNTLRCKRCKGIWKPGEEDIRWTVDSGRAIPTGRAAKRPEPLAQRLAERLDVCLARSGGRFCPDTLPWQAGDISREVFGKYVRQCVKERTLAEERDRYGRTWYRRPR